jgi:DNA-binding response OmpR family regulator
MKITIIEDDVAIGFSLRIALEDRGHEVTVYEDPTTVPYDALDTDVILLDYFMPKMNGEQVLTRLRQNHSLETVKIILMSASPHMAAVAKSLHVHLLPKPFDLPVLYQYVEAP